MSFLFEKHQLDMIYLLVKLHEAIPNGSGAMVWTQILAKCNLINGESCYSCL